MYLGTRTTRTCITHFPEVIVFVSVEDMIFWQELFPIGSGFIVTFQSFFGAAFEYGGVKVIRIYLQNIYQVFPCPVDCLFLKVVTERPVAQHLEHGMVVRIVSYFFQVIMLSANAQAFLRVRDSFIFCRVVTQNNIFELVHPRISKHQCRVIFNYHWSRGHYLMAFALEETLERVSDFICSQHTSV